MIESTLGTRRYQKDQKVKTIGTRETNRIREQKKKKNLEKTTKPSNQMAFCIIKKARKRKIRNPTQTKTRKLNTHKPKLAQISSKNGNTIFAHYFWKKCIITIFCVFRFRFLLLLVYEMDYQSTVRKGGGREIEIDPLLNVLFFFSNCYLAIWVRSFGARDLARELDARWLLR